jgi:hypothetical protein
MSDTSLLPAILDGKAVVSLPVSSHESALLAQARKLFDGAFYDHALLGYLERGRE